MKKTIDTLIFALILCLCCASCGKATDAADLWETAMYTEDTELGDGAKTFQLEVKAEEKSVVFTIHTDKKSVGDALMENHLVAGEKGPYGLYVKVVNGMTADYDKDQTYWELCKNGESLSTGVDGTEFADGDRYEFVYKK